MSPHTVRYAALGRMLVLAACALGAACTHAPATSPSKDSPRREVNESARREANDNAKREANDSARREVVECLLPDARDRPKRAKPEPLSIAECEHGGGRWARAQGEPDDLLRLWLPAANGGDPEARTRVGELYERGIGSLPDPETAAKWYKRAVDAGWAPAMIHLASLYERGLGVPRDAEQAGMLYRRASGLQGTAAPPLIQFVKPLVTERLDPNEPPLRVAVTPGKTDPWKLLVRITSDVGLQRVTINDEKVSPGRLGNVYVEMKLGPEPVPVRVVAIDRNGQQTVAELSLVLASDETSAKQTTPATATRSAARGGSDYALIIANQAYSDYPRLDTPLRDGRDMNDLLSKRFGFETKLLVNATRQDILAALTSLRDQLGQRDRLLIYYAGHGEVDAATGRGYWIPVDGRKRSPANWVSVVDIADQLNAVRAREVIVIADSCFAGTLGRATVRATEVDLSADAREAAAALGAQGRARVAITSGGLEPVVDGGGGRNSLFARSLLEVLRTVRKPTEARRLFNALNARFIVVANQMKVDQRPIYAPVRFAGHERGDFMFVPQPK